MRLYLLRHADADAASHWTDADRPLSPAGKEEAETIAEAIRAMKLSFNAVFSSPLVRARQTAEIAVRYLPPVAIQPLEQLRPGSDPQSLFRELQSLPRDTHALLVSHEPFVSRCIGRLISAESEPNISIKKASLTCVEVGSPVQRGAGVLLWMITNENFRAIKS